MHYDKAYVIGSYDLDPKRLNRFFKKNKLTQRTITQWPAIIGTQVDIDQRIKGGYLVEDFSLRMPGLLGCLLSQVTLWQHCQQDKNCDIALIFEDDPIIKPDFEARLAQIDLKELPPNWTMLRLSYKGLIGEPISKHIIKPTPITKRGHNAGTWCYLINTQNIQTIIDRLLPYNNKSSMDVILRKHIAALGIYFSAYNHAKHNQLAFSSRKFANLSIKKTFYHKLKFNLCKQLYR